MVLVATGLALLGWALAEARRDPVVRRLSLAVPGWPMDQRPLTIALLSDLHVSAPTTPPERLVRIVAQVNRLAPDMVVLAGDFVSNDRFDTRWYTSRQATAPLAALRAPLGVWAVLGNHDHYRDAAGITAGLEAAGVHVLSNTAARAGPLAIGGVDDPYTGYAMLQPVLGAFARLGGVPILLAHSPDIFPAVPTAVPLVLAGHTHCGQVAPWPIGPVLVPSVYGTRYACGVIREKGHTLVVTAGIGTSDVPLRLGAPPDLWLVTVGPARRLR